MMPAATAKLAALTATPMTGLPVSSSRPPIPGPTTTIRFSTVAKIEFAAARSFSPATSGVSAPAAGRYGMVATLDRAVSASTGPMEAPTPTTTAMPVMITALARAETMSTVTR